MFRLCFGLTDLLVVVFARFYVVVFFEKHVST